MSAKQNDTKQQKQQRPETARREMPDFARSEFDYAPHPGGFAQLARQDPSQLNSQQILQLQRTLGNREVNQLLQRKPDAVVQRDGPTREEVDDAINISEAREGSSRESFQQLNESINQALANGTFQMPDESENFDASRQNFTGLERRVHRYIERYRNRANESLFGTNEAFNGFATRANTDLEFYINRGVDVTTIQSMIGGAYGFIQTAEVSYSRLRDTALNMGIAETDTLENSRGNTLAALNQEEMDIQAEALQNLVQQGGGNFVVGTTNFQSSVGQYQQAWRDVTTAQNEAVTETLRASRAFNAQQDDSEQAELTQINQAIQVTDQIVSTINSTMGNISSLQSNMAAWQSQVIGASVGVGNNMQPEVQDARVQGVDFDQAVNNIRSHVPGAVTAGGSLIKFIFQADIDRCNAAINTVNQHEQAFQNVIGNVEAVTKLRNLRDKLNHFQLQAVAVADAADAMRDAANNFGADIDRELQQQGVLDDGQEAAVPNMILVSQIREAAVYYQNALTSVNEVIDRVGSMKTRLRLWKDGSSATTDLNRLREYSTEMGEEINRYTNAFSTFHRMKRLLTLRSTNMNHMMGQFNSALSGRQSTSGNDRF